MTIEERLAAAERRIEALERRLGPAPVTTLPVIVPPTGIPPTHPWPVWGSGGVQIASTGEWPHAAGSRA